MNTTTTARLEAATEWHNRTSKADLLAWATAQGLDIGQHHREQLYSDWNERLIAHAATMGFYAVTDSGGMRLGVYPAASASEACDQCARDAGYRDAEHAAAECNRHLRADPA